MKANYLWDMNIWLNIKKSELFFFYIIKISSIMLKAFAVKNWFIFFSERKSLNFIINKYHNNNKPEFFFLIFDNFFGTKKIRITN